MKEAGFNVTHLYGLTETYGPAVVNDWHGAWDALSSSEQAAKKARQGVRYPMLEGLNVIDPDTMAPVPRDGATIGEVMFRGNVVMKGYLKNKPASDKAFAGGWFHSGDLGVMHLDGYLELRDRAKDVIISGGENISTIEVEQAVAQHPAVMKCAVIAIPDEQWGEAVHAVVVPRAGHEVDAATLIAFCHKHIAGYKVPKQVDLRRDPLPKSGPGKVLKRELRAPFWAGHRAQIN